MTKRNGRQRGEDRSSYFLQHLEDGDFGEIEKGFSCPFSHSVEEITQKVFRQAIVRYQLDEGAAPVAGRASILWRPSLLATEQTKNARSRMIISI